MNIKKLDKKDLFVLLCGLCISIRIQIVGTFLLSEFFLLLYYLGGSLSAYKQNKNVKKLIFLAFLWLAGTIISNVVNHIDTIDSLKGIFTIIILIFLIPPIYQLMYDKPERILLFSIGYGISGLFMPYFAVSDQQAAMWQADVYRFYAYAGLVASFCYYLYYKGKRRQAIILLEAVSLVGLFNASRNLFLTTTVAAIILLYILKNKNGVANFSQKIPALLLVLLIGVLMVDFVYENLASTGFLGEKAYEKYITQKTGGNIVEGGRTATFMGIELIKEKPITGWGSYAKDTWGFMSKYYSDHNMEDTTIPELEYELPSHSYVVGAWMQNGILGGLFWFWILFMLWKIFKSGCLLYEPRVLGLLIFRFTTLLWNWAFSPFGDRTTFLFLMLTYMAIYDNYYKGLYTNQNYIVKRLQL